METNVKIYRKTKPLEAQKIWDCIKLCSQQKQALTHQNIFKFCLRKYVMDRETFNTEFGNMIEDRLVNVRKSVFTHGAHKGAEQVTYSIPVKSGNIKGKHDWYCFLCHNPGPVIDCSTCHRVYHPHCLETKNVRVGSPFICELCQECTLPRPMKITRSKLNKLLQCACSSLQYKLPLDVEQWNPDASVPISTHMSMTDRSASLQNKKLRTGQLTSPSALASEEWRSKLLIHPRGSLDLSVLESKADRLVYRHLNQFKADAATVVHNVIIFHGEHSAAADAARQMYRECLRDLDQMTLCHNCYWRSYQHEEDADWFCRPCRPPHELAFVRQKGYPFWPAKILSTNGNKVGVRFFGSQHERAEVDRSNVRPIDTDTKSLGVKKNANWTKSYEELQRHLQMLQSNNSTDSSDLDSRCTSEDEDCQVNPAGKVLQTPTKEVRVSLSKCDTLLQVSALKSEAVASASSLQPPPPKRLRSSDNVVDLTPESLENINGGCLSEDLVSSSVGNTDPSLNDEKVNHLLHKMQVMTQHLNNKDKEIRQLKEQQAKDISAVKKKQWCFTCEQEATMNCCWNASYCGAECQKLHWHRGHRKRCQRQRAGADQSV